MMRFRCAFCGRATEKPNGHVNRARRSGMLLFCNRTCSGNAKRKHKTAAEKKEEKRLYDQAYRALNIARIKANKRDYNLRTYDPAKAAVERKKKMPRHVEYCRRPEYKRWKQGYDRRHRAEKVYGPFAEAAMVVNDLNLEIKSRSTNYEIRRENQTFGKRQARSREAGDPRSYGHRSA